jgi:hypothetical protein
LRTRRRPDAQDARRLLGSVPEQVHEQEGGPLSRREAQQEPPNVGAHLSLDELITRVGRRNVPPQRHRRATPAHPEPVQRDAEQVPGGVLDLVDRVPPFPELHEGILGQIFRVLAAPRDELEGLVQAFVFLLDERVETGPCVDALGRECHDLPLCSHVTWMHERRVPSRWEFASVRRRSGLVAPAAAGRRSREGATGCRRSRDKERRPGAQI